MTTLNMILRAVLLAVILALALRGQTTWTDETTPQVRPKTILVFTPQAVVGKRAPLQLWAVSGMGEVPSAALVYILALRHGVQFIEPSVVQARLTTKEKRSVFYRVLQYGTYASIVGAEIVNLRLVTAASAWGIGLNSGMGVLSVLLPRLQQDLPKLDPGVAGRLTSSPMADSQGNISWLFFAEPSDQKGFWDTF